MLTAGPGDDFGVSRVTFYDGPWEVGAADRTPYRVNYMLPTDIACATRTLTAVVTDSSGQTAATSKKIAIDAADCVEAEPPTPQPAPEPDAVDRRGQRAAQPAPPLARDAHVPAAWPLRASSRSTCSSATTPVHADRGPVHVPRAPTGEDVGVQVVRAVVVDLAGRTAETSIRVEVPRFAPRSVSVSIKSQNRSRNRVTKTITAEVRLPDRVTAAQGCAGGIDHARDQARRQGHRRQPAAAQPGLRGDQEHHGLPQRVEEVHDPGPVRR